MAIQKNYKYEGGQLVECEGFDMVGWEYIDGAFTKRVICESIGIYNHANLAEAKYVIQVNVNGKWVDYSREIAVVSKNTYCLKATAEPVSEADAYEYVDDLDNPQFDEDNNISSYAQKKVLKSTVAIEWDFYYPVFFNPQSPGANMYQFVKHGAEIKTGISL